MKPVNFPKWATLDENDPITGAPNKREPSAEFQSSGLKRLEPFFRDHVNYQFDLINQWLEYLDTVNSTISEDKTVYVATTGNDTTGTGDILAPFATPHKAIESLIGTPIATDVIVTIFCAAGVYTFTSLPLTLNHPYGERIHIVGDTLLGNVPSRAPIADWSDRSNPVVPPRAIDELNNSSGSLATNADMATREVAITADLISNKALLESRFSTVFKFVTSSGIKIQGNNSIGLVDKILIEGDWDGTTIEEEMYHGIESGDAAGGESAPLNVTGGTAYIGSSTAVIGFRGDGYRARYGGAIGCQDGVVSANNMTKGFSAISSTIVANGSTAQGNIQNNYFAFGGGLLRAQSSFSSGSISTAYQAQAGGVCRIQDAEGYGNFFGANSTGNGTVSADNLIIKGSGSNGLLANNNGTIDADNGDFSDNNLSGVLALGGRIDIQTSTIENNGVHGVAALNRGTVGTVLCTIQDNVGHELVAQADGTILANAATIPSGSTITAENRSFIQIEVLAGVIYSPAHNTLGNTQSIIATAV